MQHGHGKLFFTTSFDNCERKENQCIRSPMMHDCFFWIFIAIYLSRYNSCYYDNRISMYAPVRVRMYVHNVEYIYFYTIHTDCYQNFWSYSNVINLYVSYTC